MCTFLCRKSNVRFFLSDKRLNFMTSRKESFFVTLPHSLSRRSFNPFQSFTLKDCNAFGVFCCLVRCYRVIKFFLCVLILPFILLQYFPSLPFPLDIIIVKEKLNNQVDFNMFTYTIILVHLYV